MILNKWNVRISGLNCSRTGMFNTGCLQTVKSCFRVFVGTYFNPRNALNISYLLSVTKCDDSAKSLLGLLQHGVEAPSNTHKFYVKF